MQTTPVALSELLRLAFPGGSEFIGTSEQRSRVVQWATVINLPLHDEAEVAGLCHVPEWRSYPGVEALPRQGTAQRQAQPGAS